jgi:LPXTG-motif cell wall-anchored protein
MRIAAPLLALLVILSGTLPAAAVAGASVTPSTAATEPAAPIEPALAGPSHARIDEPIVTELYIDPDPGGDARWNVSIRYNLSSDADRAAFEQYGRAFEDGDGTGSLDVAFFRTLADGASRATGREMAIRDVRYNATQTNDTGVLSLTFTWTNFVTDTEDGFLVQDAVLMPGDRTWLASIDPSQRLIVDTPEGYQVTDTRFGLDNGSVVIEGPHTFSEPLTISYQETAPEQPEQSTPWLLIGGALLLGIGLAVVYVRRRSGRAESGRSPVDGGVTAPSARTESETETAAEPEAPPSGTDERPAGDGRSDDGGEASDETDGETDDQTGDADGIDPALLSDEERVERLLTENGGRMKQARIVRETGWSDAKVSQLLSTMADDGRVEKLRLGRENLISLSDEDPDT